MKKLQLWPWLALAGGCGAFLLRWAQLRLGFEADTGLPVPGDPWGVVLPLLLAALAILFLALSRGAPAGVTAEASLGRAFPVEKSLLPLLGGLLWLVSGAFQMMDAGSPEPVESFDSSFAASLSRGAMIAGILTVLSAVCLFCTLSPSPREGRRAEPNAVPLLGAAAALVVRLVLRYRALSMDPSLQAYYRPLVALTVLCLGFYFASAFAFGAGRDRRFLPAACPSAVTPIGRRRACCASSTVRTIPSWGAMRSPSLSAWWCPRTITSLTIFSPCAPIPPISRTVPSCAFA